MAAGAFPVAWVFFALLDFLAVRDFPEAEVRLASELESFTDRCGVLRVVDPELALFALATDSPFFAETPAPPGPNRFIRRPLSHSSG